MAATALISFASAIVAPDRIAKVHGAGIGGRADQAASNAASEGAHGRIACHSPYRRAACPANQGATCHTIAGIGAATGKEQRDRKTCTRECDAHGILLRITCI
jgi:hypothetical protein